MLEIQTDWTFKLQFMWRSSHYSHAVMLPCDNIWCASFSIKCQVMTDKKEKKISLSSYKYRYKPAVIYVDVEWKIWFWGCTFFPTVKISQSPLRGVLIKHESTSRLSSQASASTETDIGLREPFITLVCFCFFTRLIKLDNKHVNLICSSCF